MGLTAKDAEIIVAYEKLARETLPIFDREFSPFNKRAFFIVTKLHNGNFYEQIYVKVQSRNKDGYHGIIDSVPSGKVDFKRGAPIDVADGNVADWVIVSPDGEEEGNLTGKAMEALAAKTIVFIIGMKPVDGKFTQFRVASVKNPKTQQEIRDIVPNAVFAQVEKEAAARFSKLKAEDEKEKYQFILAGFPSWRLIAE